MKSRLMLNKSDFLKAIRHKYSKQLVGVGSTILLLRPPLRHGSYERRYCHALIVRPWRQTNEGRLFVLHPARLVLSCRLRTPFSGKQSPSGWLPTTEIIRYFEPVLVYQQVQIGYLDKT